MLRFMLRPKRGFKVWAESGRPKYGPTFEYMKRANLIFEYALRYIKRNENTLRSDTLAKNLQSNSPIDFWKEDNSKTILK